VKQTAVAGAVHGTQWCAARGKRYGRPPHTGVPKIGGRPYHSPRDVVSRRIFWGGHRRQIDMFVEVCSSEARSIRLEQRLGHHACSATDHAVDVVHRFLDSFSPQARAQWLALAADDFGYSRMRRPPKTAAERVRQMKHRSITKSCIKMPSSPFTASASSYLFDIRFAMP